MIRKSAAIVLVLSLAVVALALVPASGLAAKGQRGPGGGGTGATISFDPGSTVVGSQYRVNGSGFAANTWVTVGAYYADTTWWTSGVTDGQGNFSWTLTATSAGHVLHEAKEMGNNQRFRLRASATLTVSPAP